ncbi:unnamed protein product [Agarophyton chilense]
MDPNTGKQIDRYRSVLEVGIRGKAYSQRNTYIWDDGRKQVKEFGGGPTDGGFEIRNNVLKGTARSIGGSNLLFIAGLKESDTDATLMYEIVQMLGDDKRARMYQRSDGTKIISIVHVIEERVSTDDVFFDVSFA